MSAEERAAKAETQRDRAEALLVLGWTLEDAIFGANVPSDIAEAAREIANRYIDHPNIRMLRPKEEK